MNTVNSREMAGPMASLFEDGHEHVRLLDPGAGAGVLFAMSKIGDVPTEFRY